MSSFLDQTGLAYFWQKIRANVVTSVNGQKGDVTVSGGLTPVLLWTNSNPTVDYGSTLLTLSTTTQYTALIVVFGLQTTNVVSGASALVLAGHTSRVDIPWGGGTSIISVHREVSFDYEDGNLDVSFSDATQNSISSGSVSHTTNNSRCIPLQIYGLF